MIHALLSLDRTGGKLRAFPHEYRRLFDRLEGLGPVAHCWHGAADAYRLRPTGPPQSRTPADQERGSHREPLGEDHAKRGAGGDVRGKKIKGRTRHLLVDATGLILHVLVPEANIQDAGGGKPLLAPLKDCFPPLQLIWAASGSKKEGFCEGGSAELGWQVEIVEQRLAWPARRAGPARGRSGWGEDPTARVGMCFPSVGWSNGPWPGFRAFRRLSKDDEVLQSSEEAWISVAMIRLMLRRLAHTSS